MASRETGDGMIHFSTAVGHEGGFFNWTSPVGGENSIVVERTARGKYWPITRSRYAVTHNQKPLEPDVKARSTITALISSYRQVKRS